MNADAVAAGFIVHNQTGTKLISGVYAYVLVKGKAQIVNRREKVSVSKQVHSEQLSLDKQARRVRQVKASVGPCNRYGGHQRRTRRYRSVMYTIMGNLRSCAQARRRVKEVD